MKLSLILLGALVRGSAGAAIPKHAQFSYDSETGLVSLAANSELRLNVKGGIAEPEGNPVILWPCGPLDHELFKFENGLIKSNQDPNMCLNIAGGANEGSPLQLWPCEHGGDRVAHEEFDIRNDGRIALKQKPTMCLNVEGGAIMHGTRIVLWPCRSTPNSYELFSFNDGYIQVKENTNFHFNIQGEVKPEAGVVLWDCQAAPHEALEFSADGRIKFKSNPGLCLNAEGGVAAGHRIISWPCSQTPDDNEKFKYDAKKKIIYSTTNPEFGFNAAGAGMKAGDEIVLWHYKDDEL